MIKILVAVDLLNDFITGSLGSVEAQAIVGKAASKIRNYDGEIYKLCDMHRSDYLDTQEGVNLPVKHCLMNTEGAKINREVEAALIEKGFTCIIKDTFGSIELAEKLRYLRGALNTLSIEIELIGLCTDICIISNALILKAFIPDVKIIVDASCCAGTTPEKHKAALEVMKSCQIQIINE